MASNCVENRGPASRREVFAWCMYDFANSSYTTVIITVAFSVYFTTVVAGGEDGNGERLWGWGYALSMLVIGLMAPLLGAVADHGGFKKRFLLFFTSLCILATSALFFVGPGDIVLGLMLLALSNIGFNGGMHFYNSFLIDVSDRSNIGRISGYGWALGYVGGLLCLILVYPLIKGGLVDANLASYRLSFPLTALFFLVASIPTFLFLRERSTVRANLTAGHHIRGGLRRMIETFHEIRKFRELTKYFFGYLLYTDGINTVAVFSAIFANKVLGFTPGEIVMYFVVVNVSAALGALAFGPITDRLGARGAISITLVILTGVMAGVYMVETKTGFYIVGLVAGAAMGSNQAASRALLGLFTPHGKNAEFFGFFATVGKFSAVLGPIIYGEVTAATGNQRYAILTIGAFFLVGLLLLQFVDEKKGKEAAEGFEETHPLK
ncbi:MAG: MFS transporter [Thermodesulfobacteriota bacterium]